MQGPAIPPVDLQKASEPAASSGDEGANAVGLLRSPTSCTRRDIGSRISSKPKPDEDSALSPVLANLLSHGVPDRVPDNTARAVVTNGLMQNRFCQGLQNTEMLLEHMQYFEFRREECVVRQADPGRYFFVIDSGEADVLVSGSRVASMGPGATFGGIALLYNCPRTATVTATTDTLGVWGFDGTIFRHVLKCHGLSKAAENRKFLTEIRAFDNLPARHKHRLAELPMVPESFTAGARVVSQGEIAPAIYFVKKGDLDVMRGGQFDQTGTLLGGEKVARMGPGDVFGVKSAFYNAPRGTSIIAVTNVEMVCIPLKNLRDVLGEDIGRALHRSFVDSVLRRLPFVAHLTLKQRSELVHAIEIAPYGLGETLPESDTLVVVVVSGSITAVSQDPTHGGVTTRLEHGACCLVEDLANITGPEGCIPIPVPRPNGVRVCEEGTQLATLTRAGLASALEIIGISVPGGTEFAAAHLRNMVLVKRVNLLKDLSEEQIHNLVSSLQQQVVPFGTKVIIEGEAGDSFYLLSKGDVRVLQHEQEVGTLHAGDCFGERALVLDEARSATVEVTSEFADLWVADKETFLSLITENMRQTLVNNIKLKGTAVTLKHLVHERFLGQGGFGSVRLVSHKFTAVRYALKRVKKTSEQVEKDVRRECAILQRVKHGFLLQLARTFETAGSIYILTELITGGSLYDQLGRMGVLTRKQCQFYIGALALVMEVVHEQNIVYRDLKPENVMLDTQGYPKLIDFGLAKSLETESRCFTLVGTVFYMAPEVITGKGYGMDCDMWSVGVMMYEMVCGCLPFGDGCHHDQEILSSVLQDPLTFPSRYNDSAGKRLMQGLLNKNPEQRLGAGLDGWEDVKAAKFFTAGVKGNLFYQIAGREFPAPCVPREEQFIDERDLTQVTASDAEELATA